MRNDNWMKCLSVDSLNDLLMNYFSFSSHDDITNTIHKVHVRLNAIGAIQLVNWSTVKRRRTNVPFAFSVTISFWLDIRHEHAFWGYERLFVAIRCYFARPESFSGYSRWEGIMFALYLFLYGFRQRRLKASNTTWKFVSYKMWKRWVIFFIS